jgi:LemA protein
MILFYIFLAVIVILAFWAVAIYNSLVRNRNMVKEGWSGIEVQLKRRADLIPNLIETVKGYMGHERGVLEKVTELRAQSEKIAEVGEKGRVEGMLGAALGKLIAVAENYPDLKASKNFQDLQAQLAAIEEQIQMARRYYNGTARDFNIAVESFPGNIVAGMFRFITVEYFEIEEAADRAVPQVKF